MKTFQEIREQQEQIKAKMAKMQKRERAVKNGRYNRV